MIAERYRNRNRFNSREPELIEAGDYKLYQGEYKGVMVTSIIKRSFRTTLIAADHEIPKEEEKDFMAAMINFGRLCDSYISKKQALKDLDYLMTRDSK